MASTEKTYFFLDINLQTREIIGWGTEAKSTVETELSRGFHRVFLSRGQFNKLTRQLEGESS